MKKYILLGTAVLFLILMLIGCHEMTKNIGQEKEPRKTTVEEARLISHITDGIISPEGKIAVRFQQNQILKTQVNLPLKKKVFLFNPGIDGVVKWEDRRTLVFQPNHKLKMRQTYVGSLDLKKLFPGADSLKVKSISIKFETSGREISDLQADFQLTDKSDPQKVILQGRLKFTQDTDLDTVKEAVLLHEDSDGQESKTDARLTFSGKQVGQEFTFKSAIIVRTEQEKTFTLIIEKERLELSKTREEKFCLPGLKDFTVKKIAQEIKGKNLSVQILFSDELSPQKNYDGFVQIQPFLKFKLKNMGKNLIITGDFRHGEGYQIKIVEGLENRWGMILAKEKVANIKFPNMKPKIEFTHSGVYLPSVNRKKIFFKTVNVERVKISVKKVFEDNLGILLQSSNLNGQKDRRYKYNPYEFKRVGVTVLEKELEIGLLQNQWLQSELDFAELFKDKDKGIYVLELSFGREDLLYEFPDDWESWQGDNYLRSNGVVVKPVILSDLALLVKQSENKLIVFVSDVITTKPLRGVIIKLKSYQDQVIAQAKTDYTGRCELLRKDGFYLEAEYQGQRSVLKFSEDELDNSVFDTGGLAIPDSGLRAFIYTERGVYRPGDTINLSLIARNQENTFPENHPITLTVFNPKKRKVIEKTVKKGRDGFYSFSFKTKENDPTGQWKTEVKIGSNSFYHPIRVETVVPYRLKVNIESTQERITLKDREIKATISAQYLFGNPASNLDSEVVIKVEPYQVKFDQYRAFNFGNPEIDFKTITSPVFESKLSQSGQTGIKWELPKIDKASSGLRAVIEAKVLEKGGRPVPREQIIPIDLYKYYVGIQGPKEEYLSVGSPISLTAILVSDKDEMVSGRKLNYQIYQGQSYWWWDYDSLAEFRKHFKSDYSTELRESGTVTSSSEPVLITYTPENYGEILIEVQDGDSGHTAASFFRAYSWASESGARDAHILKMKADKEVYHDKDTAKVICQTPEKGQALISLEKGGRVLKTYWKKLEQRETVIEVPISQEMIPTVYLSVSVIQPHSQTQNDNPIRMYGVVPLKVEEEKTHLNFYVKTPQEINPGKEFSVEIQTLDLSPAQFTVAVVDEGLLDLTNYQTPSPWGYFFQKELLRVKTFDIFSKVIGADWGDVYKVFSLGGGFDETKDEVTKRLSPVKVKRFKPVSLFQGPLSTNEKGKAQVKFKMPNYIGSVRVMVVGAKSNSYGSKEKVISVKSPLMVMPTLPRVLGPQDQIVIPVTVFATRDDLGEVEVIMTVEGVVQPVGETKMILSFSEKGEKDIYFSLRAQAAMGSGTIKISASSRDFAAEDTTEIAVRPSAPYTYFSQEKVLTPEIRVKFEIRDEGIAGSNHCMMTISKRPDLAFNRRLQWLIRYPYGCIEQVTSSVFPQLYMKDIFDLDQEKAQKMDENINAAINKLRAFQLSNGGFSYWPNGSKVNLWGTNYAGHFMIEAKKMGYYVPEDMYQQWIKFQKGKSRTTSDHSLTNIYRAYLLTLADEAPLGAINLLRENYLEEMSNAEKWLLGAAYVLLGEEATAQDIVKNAKLTVQDYTEFAGTYGSSLRDQAIILECLTIMKDYDQGLLLYQEITRRLSGNQWYSTQTIAYSLLAIGEYLKINPSKEEIMKGEILLPESEKIEFETDEPTYTWPITQGFGKELEVIVRSQDKIFGNLEWEGIPLKDTVPTESKNIQLKAEWLDEDGMVINPENIEQGTAFWGHFTLRKGDYGPIEEMALVQILPAGWEIENIRLLGGKLPEWMKDYTLNTEDYLDIRDDRIMWFFDFDRPRVDFVVRLNAVTVGEFYLPPTSAEAMYDHDYRATIAGKRVRVRSRQEGN